MTVEICRESDEKLALRFVTGDRRPPQVAYLHWSYDRARGVWLAPSSDLPLIMQAFPGVRIQMNKALGTEVATASAKRAASAAVAPAGELIIPVPDGLELMPFQVAGVEWIERCKGRALIADEMGLGKTIQALSWLNLHPDHRPAIVVCPNSVKLNWKAEAERWLIDPNDRVEVGAGGKPKPTILKSATILVLNYDILHRWVEALGKVAVAILDEAHYVKSRDARRSGAAKALCAAAKHVIALTGTPILNRPIEAWHQVACIDPSVFPNFEEYAREYCGGSGKGRKDPRGHSNLSELEEILRHRIMVRRLKADVLPDLPEKRRTTILIEVPLPEYQKHEAEVRGRASRFKELKEALRAMLEGVEDDAERKRLHADSVEGQEVPKLHGVLMRDIEQLKQDAVRAKYPQMLDWLTNALGQEHKVIVFAHHIEIQHRLIRDLEGYGAAKILGGMSIKQRQENVDRFQTVPECRVIVCSLGAAAYGINLQAASQVVFAELGWNPSHHDQGEDRAHRHGQKNPVNAWYMVAVGTIEEEIARLIEAKRAVVSAGQGDVDPFIEQDGIMERVIDYLAGGPTGGPVPAPAGDDGEGEAVPASEQEGGSGEQDGPVSEQDPEPGEQGASPDDGEVLSSKETDAIYFEAIERGVKMGIPPWQPTAPAAPRVEPEPADESAPPETGSPEDGPGTAPTPQDPQAPE